MSSRNESQKDQKSNLVVAVISSTNLKAFSAAFHYLFKVGKDVSIEFEHDKMTLQTLNDAKSAFATINFSNRGYFEQYQIEDEVEDTFVCRLLLKPICSILSPRNIKNVKLLKLYNILRISGECELIFEFHSNKDIKHIHRFCYSDCDIISAVFDDSSALCSLRAVPEVFIHLIEFVQSSEIIIEADFKNFKIRSYHPQHQYQPNKMRTSTSMTSAMSLETNEFDEYHFKRKNTSHSNNNNHQEKRRNFGNSYTENENQEEESQDPLETENMSEELVFCVREMRAFLLLCECINIPNFKMLFSSGGQPIKFVAVLDHSFSVQLIMASLQSQALSDLQSTQDEEHNSQALVPPTAAIILPPTPFSQRVENSPINVTSKNNGSNNYYSDSRGSVHRNIVHPEQQLPRSDNENSDDEEALNLVHSRGNNRNTTTTTTTRNDSIVNQHDNGDENSGSSSDNIYDISNKNRYWRGTTSHTSSSSARKIIMSDDEDD